MQSYKKKIHFVQIQKKPKNYTTFGTHTFVHVFDAFKGQIRPQFGIRWCRELNGGHSGIKSTFLASLERALCMFKAGSKSQKHSHDGRNFIETIILHITHINA